MTLQIRPEDLKTVREAFAQVDGEIYIFGSRARGTARQDSDLDVCIKSTRGRVGLDVLSRLREILEESSLPFDVDIVDFVDLPPAFQQSVEAEGIALSPIP